MQLEDRTKAFQEADLAADYKKRSANVRHNLENLRAALRMLEGVRLKKLITRVEYEKIVGQMKNNSVDDKEKADLGSLIEPTALEWWELTGDTPYPNNPTRKVLLIDDHAEAHAWDLILKPLCRECGASLGHETKLEDGIERMRKTPYDAVLLDLHYENIPPEQRPDPFEVLKQAQDASLSSAIIVFTTEMNGVTVRDLTRDSFHYFFKEIDKKEGAKVIAYADKFQEILRSAFDNAISVMLRSFVRLMILNDTDNKFFSVRSILEIAAERILKPEVSLALITGAVQEILLIYMPSSSENDIWKNIQNVMINGSKIYEGLIKQLPFIVKNHRNYASHYQEISVPPTLLDAVVYLLVVTLITAELQSCDTVAVQRPGQDAEQRRRLFNLLRQVILKLSQDIGNPKVLATISPITILPTSRETAGVFEKSRGKFFRIYSAVLNIMMNVKDEKAIKRSGGHTYYSSFADLLRSWFERDKRDELMWIKPEECIAPYIFYLCSFILLERVAQMHNIQA